MKFPVEFFYENGCSWNKKSWSTLASCDAIKWTVGRKAKDNSVKIALSASVNAIGMRFTRIQLLCNEGFQNYWVCKVYT